MRNIYSKYLQYLQQLQESSPTQRDLFSIPFASILHRTWAIV